ncbi:hypothetical protein CYMTET_41278 [Cymbomonas tetramitiformis]|uniref:TauD/TfdA-like domain-containing protein n=1 Tax=Cymbomonas tetramitiformis TaxID=36881 RepID=A0AAE0C7T1_9CHLO|nr:hypothetical protein CYMTET_41278 [Cymbomonas tetramitiformis]
MYSASPLSKVFGAEIRGIRLATAPLTQELVQQIKHDVAHHRLLIFKDQGQLEGAKQVELSKKLGAVESTFYQHPRSPNPDIFRVSNDPKEGCTNVGRTGWHLDGTFQACPFKYQTMHFHSVIPGGDTLFVPLRELYDRQEEETRERWNKLWFATGREFVHPLVYQHPVRGDTTLCFHCGEPFCAGWILEQGEANAERPSLQLAESQTNPVIGN